jgi:signal peptidase II
MGKKYLPLLTLPPLVIALDQLTKWWVVKSIPLRRSVEVIPNFFHLTHIKNRGAAFGVFSQWEGPGREWFFYLISAVAIVALFVLYAKSEARQRRLHVPLALILGGAIGNLIDRLIHGEVTDFLLFHWYEKVADFTLLGKHFRFALSWPAFNIADTAITCGALYLLVVVLFFDKRKPITSAGGGSASG